MRRQFSIILTVLLACGAIGVFRDAAKMAGSSPPLNEAIIVSSRAQQKPVTPPPLEGCLKCHDKIEPMHRYGPTVAGALDSTIQYRIYSETLSRLSWTDAAAAGFPDHNR